jgi:hypothetical protein
VAPAFRRLFVIVLAAGIGFGIGYLVAGANVGLFSLRSADHPELAEQISLPHHVPPQANGAALCFAMVHDVIHERFPRHGPAHYEERNRLTRAALAKKAANDPDSFALSDDLAIGLERLGRSEEALAVMRDKIARQQAIKYTGRGLYTSSAILGTLLVQARFARAAAGDAEAMKEFREGVGLIRKAIAMNPGAHFGREQWQAAFAEFLLASIEKPEVLRKFDCLGNRIDLSANEDLFRSRWWQHLEYGHASNKAFRLGHAASAVPEFFHPEGPLDDPSLWPAVRGIRKFITKVGAEDGWLRVPVPSHREPVPFDEPMLGIIDMWRTGGGANPHFALACGEAMLRVGQRFIAWTAYERASRTADRFWPDPALQQFLRDHCRRMQEQIEKTLSGDESAASLRSRFDEELAHGEQYQQAYQRHEANEIAAGVSINDKHLFDAFHASHDPIASPVGPEESLVHVPQEKMDEYRTRRGQTWGVFAAGLAAMATALVLRWRAIRRRESFVVVKERPEAV